MIPPEDVSGDASAPPEPALRVIVYEELEPSS